VAGSLPVKRRAGPECRQAKQVERAGHIDMVEAGLGQAAVSGASRAVAGSLLAFPSRLPLSAADPRMSSPFE
jgi:hypothetical protein